MKKQTNITYEPYNEFQELLAQNGITVSAQQAEKIHELTELLANKIIDEYIANSDILRPSKNIWNAQTHASHTPE